MSTERRDAAYSREGIGYYDEDAEHVDTHPSYRLANGCHNCKLALHAHFDDGTYSGESGYVCGASGGEPETLPAVSDYGICDLFVAGEWHYNPERQVNEWR